jgi:hypothetical protein
MAASTARGWYAIWCPGARIPPAQGACRPQTGWCRAAAAGRHRSGRELCGRRQDECLAHHPGSDCPPPDSPCACLPCDLAPTPAGKPNGQAFVMLPKEEALRAQVELNNKYMGKRFIE